MMKKERCSSALVIAGTMGRGGVTLRCVIGVNTAMDHINCMSDTANIDYSSCTIELRKYLESDHVYVCRYRDRALDNAVV